MDLGQLLSGLVRLTPLLNLMKPPSGYCGTGHL
jgi:hypothetical protein